MTLPSKLAGTSILVLGGTSGIGFSTAKLALHEGARVFVSSSNPTRVADAVSRLQESLPASHAFRGNVAGDVLDITDEAHLEANLTALFDKITSSGQQPLDHIVVTAGPKLALGGLDTITPAGIHEAGSSRLIGNMMVAKVVQGALSGRSAPFVKRSNASSLVLTGGINSARPAKGWAVPAAFAAGGEGLTRALAVDLAPVRVNLVSPGAILTELFTGLFAGEQLAQITKMYTDLTLTGAIGQPEDIAEAYLHLMKDKFMDGQVVTCDGGRTLC